MPLSDWLESRLNRRVTLANDGNCAVVGEAWLGAARGVDDVVLLTLGTGVGGGVLLRGELFTGHNGAAAEPGLIGVQPDGPACNSGNRGSLEQFASIMIPQLDLTVEASNLRRFRRDFADEDQLAFPVPIDDLTCKDVLVESFIHGDPILHFMSTAPVKEKQELAKIGLETVMKMIFLNDFVHG